MNERGVTTPWCRSRSGGGPRAGRRRLPRSTRRSRLTRSRALAEAAESRARRRWYARGERSFPDPNDDACATLVGCASTASGLSATIREIGRWRLVGGDGWATLAACVFAAAEDGETVTFLLDARARRGGGGVRGDGRARECLSEFISLVVAASSSNAWRSGRGPGAADEARLADLDAAVGHLELAETRRVDGGKRTLTHEQHAIVSADLRAEQIMLEAAAFSWHGQDDDVARVRQASTRAQVRLPHLQQAGDARG